MTNKYEIVYDDLKGNIKVCLWQSPEIPEIAASAFEVMGKHPVKVLEIKKVGEVEW